MSRVLRPLFQEFEVDPDAYRLREGEEEPPRTPSRAAVAWDLAGPVVGGFLAGGERWTARLSIPSSGGRFALDSDPALAGAPRVVTLPALRAAGLRALYRIELIESATAPASVGWRISDGAAELWHDGAAWVEATDPDADWNSAAEVADEIGSFPMAARVVQPIARLSTTSAAAGAAVFGWRIAYGVRDVGDEEDALTRTVLASLRAEVRATARIKVTSDGTVAVPLAQEPAYPSPEAVEAIYDLDADPEEEDPLAGTWNSGTRILTLASAPTAGHKLLAEVRYAPRIVVSVSRDAPEQARAPLVALSLAGAPTLYRAQDAVGVRELDALPDAWSVAGSALAEATLDVRVVAETAQDLRRLLVALRGWFGGYGVRRLLSPETGRVVQIREGDALRSDPGGLAQGLEEGRGTWLLRYEVAGGEAAQVVSLVRTGGVAASVED